MPAKKKLQQPQPEQKQQENNNDNKARMENKGKKYIDYCSLVKKNCVPLV